MRPVDLWRYVRNTEKTVVPGTVAMRVQGMGILRKLPRWLQNRIVEHGSRTDPYMRLDPEPFEAAVFPYAQHFVTTTYPTATSMRTAEDLERAVDEMNDMLGAVGESACDA